MRTLKEEIAYQREKGFYRNTIEHTTLLAWLGEQTALEYELTRLRARNDDLNAALSIERNTNRPEIDRLTAERDALRADAERWRYINERNNIWRRQDGDDPYTMLCVVLPYGTDLSCRATRENAIDAARGK